MTSKALDMLGIVGVVTILVLLIGLGPLLTIMSLNTLFGLNIAINFWTWLSCTWLFGMFATRFRK